jgi:hypothetical protein
MLPPEEMSTPTALSQQTLIRSFMKDIVNAVQLVARLAKTAAEQQVSSRTVHDSLSAVSASPWLAIA